MTLREWVALKLHKARYKLCRGSMSGMCQVYARYTGLTCSLEELALALEEQGYRVDRATWKTDARLVYKRVIY
jgi:hypothetical protein